MAKESSSFDYDVAVSFAGEDRGTVEQFVDLLNADGLKVFYDFDEQGELWGKDLYEHLDEVYSRKARYCVMFVSEHYAKKRWTNHERKSAQERAFKENCEYILPVRLDDTSIPGLRETVGYLDLRHMAIETIASLTIKKVGKAIAVAPSAKKSRGRSRASQKSTKKPSSEIVDNSAGLILLNGSIYEAQTIARPDGKRFVVTIVSHDAATDAQLNAIQDDRDSGSRGTSFAYASDAYVVRCESATSTYTAGSHQWMITLLKEDVEYGGGFMESSYSTPSGHYSPEDFARMKAERILLDKHPPPSTKRRGMADIEGAMFEMYLQGTNRPITVTGSPIVELAKKMPRTDAAQFLKIARLVALFYLKASGVVERIEKLSLGPLSDESVHVVFRGVRQKKYSNKDAEVIAVEGDCALPP